MVEGLAYWSGTAGRRVSLPVWSIPPFACIMPYLIASRIPPGLGSKIVKFQCWQRILLITRNRWSTEVAYMVNGNCLRIHLGTLQCLVETSGIVEDSDYKSQGSQEENYFLQVYGSNVVFFSFFRWSFGYVLGSHLVIRKRLLETSGICFWRFWGASQNDPKWEPTGPPIDPQMKKWTKSMSSYHFRWPGSMEVTRFWHPRESQETPKGPQDTAKTAPKRQKNTIKVKITKTSKMTTLSMKIVVFGKANVVKKGGNWRRNCPGRNRNGM